MYFVFNYLLVSLNFYNKKKKKHEPNISLSIMFDELADIHRLNNGNKFNMLNMRRKASAQRLVWAISHNWRYGLALFYHD